MSRRPWALPTFRIPLRIRCPVCSRAVLPHDCELHLVLCLTKPSLAYNEELLTEARPDSECVICLEEFAAGQTIARLPCLCIYHKRQRRSVGRRDLRKFHFTMKDQCTASHRKPLKFTSPYGRRKLKWTSLGARVTTSATSFDTGAQVEWRPKSPIDGHPDLLVGLLLENGDTVTSHPALTRGSASTDPVRSTPATDRCRTPRGGWSTFARMTSNLPLDGKTTSSSATCSTASTQQRRFIGAAIQSAHGCRSAHVEQRKENQPFLDLTGARRRLCRRTRSGKMTPERTISA
ncbi:E3 ubiquitin-protein ligase znrf1-like [Tropilaelaps mercedesae]|uniref:RING-type E3 ubiquitin transferase n=1 Tax=Tropilaelaps mercedesae TaxID=418985 RepID=A0A1V9XBA6_9ACAR|nr:E3 ubiquitin-protein ligase znrf1-like [Tropilaelaps mercedesae]